MFHVAQWVSLSLLAAFVVFCSATISPSVASAEMTDMEMATHIANLLGEKFAPESVTVSVKESRAYAEMKGAVLSKIHIDTMKLDALITGRDQPASDDVDSLASLIGYSRGEIILLERDVNAYFDNNDTKGFSGLRFKFSPKGFRADGVFSFTLLITMRIRLAAEGVLALETGGVYLDQVKIFAENMKQPDLLTRQVLERVNPLLEWSDIPFKVEFKSVSMDDEKAVMTGYPQVVEGATYTWTGAR